MSRNPIGQGVLGETIRASKLSDAVVEILERSIIDGRLPPGSMLPSERHLAAQLGVGRNSIREAVHELELKRLVERRPGLGTRVLDRALETPHGMMLGIETPGSDLLEIMDFRMAVEPPIAGLAAERATRGNLRRLQALLAEMADEIRPQSIAELDHLFHAAVATATNNRLLVRLHDVSSGWLRATRQEALQSRNRRAASLAGHRRIYEAIAARDPKAAQAAMVEHVEDIRTIIRSQTPRLDGSSD